MHAETATPDTGHEAPLGARLVAAGDRTLLQLADSDVFAELEDDLLLELSRDLREVTPDRDVRLVAFACEEPPYFHTEDMGSLRYARELTAAEVEVHGMIALESLGYFVEEKGSQKYPRGFSWFFPDRGDFVGVVGNRGLGVADLARIEG